MQALAGGWFECVLAQAQPGLRYAFRIDGGVVVPDPASRCNPDDVHGASQLTDPRALLARYRVARPTLVRRRDIRNTHWLLHA